MFTKHVTSQLSAYCNGELATNQSQRVRKHLLACRRCRNKYDEIRLGVNLAQQLPLASAPAEMWSEIEASLDERMRVPAVEPKTPKFAWAFSWQRFAIVSAVVVVAVAIGIMWSSYYGPRARGQSVTLWAA